MIRFLSLLIFYVLSLPLFSSVVLAYSMTVTKAPGSNLYADIYCNDNVETNRTGQDSLTVIGTYDLSNLSLEGKKQAVVSLGLTELTMVSFGYNAATTCYGSSTNSSSVTVFTPGSATGEVECNQTMRGTYYEYQKNIADQNEETCTDTYEAAEASGESTSGVAAACSDMGWTSPDISFTTLCDCLAGLDNGGTTSNCFPSGSSLVQISASANSTLTCGENANHVHVGAGIASNGVTLTFDSTYSSSPEFFSQLGAVACNIKDEDYAYDCYKYYQGTIQSEGFTSSQLENLESWCATFYGD